MSPKALTWAFASSVAKSSGYMLTSANVIMVSVIVADFLYRKTMPTSVFSQVRIEISTQSYSNFGLKGTPVGVGCAAPLGASVLLADPHRYEGGFQGVAYDAGQIVLD